MPIIIGCLAIILVFFVITVIGPFVAFMFLFIVGIFLGKPSKAAELSDLTELAELAASLFC